MLKSASLNRSHIYFDEEAKCIARAPTPSNFLQFGPDNSLYFGVIGISPLELPLKQILGAKDLRKINQKIFQFSSYGNKAPVLFNINAQGQIQLKMMERNLFQCFSDFMFAKTQKLSSEDYLLVLDFQSLKLFFKKKSDLDLTCN